MSQISKKELELIEYVRLEINNTSNFNMNFSSTGARKIYELVKILLHPEPQKVICEMCRKESKTWICPCKICTSQDDL